MIPSIWPETFSYTTEEIIQMGMPIMCFDIGAPAERVKKYEKGIIIPEISARAVLKTVQKEKITKELDEVSKRGIRVLFIVEEITFLSRYRVDHLREQLLHRGIASDCITIPEIVKCKSDRYASVIIYRSSKYVEIKSLIEKAHKNYLKVYYDIDDYIFDYSDIGFLRTCYYKMIKSMSEIEQMEHFTGFGLYDKSFIDVLRELDDPASFLRGIVAELGFKRKDISYEQERRKAGKTHNNWYTLYDAAMLSLRHILKLV